MEISTNALSQNTSLSILWVGKTLERMIALY